MPPTALMAEATEVPSLAVPERITPMAGRRNLREGNKETIEGRCCSWVETGQRGRVPYLMIHVGVGGMIIDVIGPDLDSLQWTWVTGILVVRERISSARCGDWDRDVCRKDSHAGVSGKLANRARESFEAPAEARDPTMGKPYPALNTLTR